MGAKREAEMGAEMEKEPEKKKKNVKFLHRFTRRGKVEGSLMFSLIWLAGVKPRCRAGEVLTEMTQAERQNFR